MVHSGRRALVSARKSPGARDMKLELQNGKILKNPTAPQIEDALRSLDYDPDQPGVILKKNTSTSMRVAQVEDMGELMYVLEYREGDHCCSYQNPAMKQVIEA